MLHKGKCPALYDIKDPIGLKEQSILAFWLKQAQVKCNLESGAGPSQSSQQIGRAHV